MQPQVYCICCDKITPYEESFCFARQTIHDIAFGYVERRAFCKECGKEVYVSEINDANAAAREAAYEKARQSQRRDAFLAKIEKEAPMRMEGTDIVSTIPDVDLGPIIQTVKPNPTEAIVLTFDTRETTLRDAAEYARRAKSAFPDNAVLALPDYISLHSCSKDVLENYISLIASVIDEEL